MITCFISHAWADGGHEFAKRLANALEANGLEVWLDEQEMHGGEQLAQEIIKGVRYECDVFLCVFSLASLKSEACTVERKEALRRRDESGLQIIPILFSDCEIPTELKDLLYIDFHDPASFDESVKQLLPSIQKANQIHALVTQLIDGDDDSRNEAAQALGYLRNPLTTQVLVRRLGADSNPIVRYELALALGKIGTAEACAALKEAKKVETDPFALLGIEDGLREAGCSTTS